MLTLNDDLSIYLTRGDAVAFSVSMYEEGVKDAAPIPFSAGDIVRFKVTEKKNCSAVVLQKDFLVEEEGTEAVNITLTSKETKLGGVISKPVDYWYEVELNPDTAPKTIIGYDDETGAKIFRLLPEGADLSSGDTDTPPYDPAPEEAGAIDSELSLTSERPVKNKVIARAITVLDDRVSDAEKYVDDSLADFRKEDNKAYAPKNHDHDGKYALETHGHVADDIPGLAAAMTAMTTSARIACGEYTGNGKWGADNPNMLTFDFEPKFLYVATGEAENAPVVYGHVRWFKGRNGMILDLSIRPSHSAEIKYLTVIDEGKTIKWYSDGSEESTGYVQLNQNGAKYSYIAIG